MIDQYTELHIVSDLHLGGLKNGDQNRQIFSQGDRFADLVHLLLKRDVQGQQGLVINGDMVDFLAEPDAMYFDVAGAAAKLDRIFRDPSFEPVWSGLKEFVKKKTEN